MTKKKSNEWKLPRVSFSIKPETSRSIYAVLAVMATLLFLVAPLKKAGIAGDTIYKTLTEIFGIGYFLLPLSLVFFAIGLMRNQETSASGTRLIGALLLFFSGIGVLAVTNEAGGTVGKWISYPFVSLFDTGFAIVILGGVAIAGSLVALDSPITLPLKIIGWIVGFFRPPEAPNELTIKGTYKEIGSENTDIENKEKLSPKKPESTHEPKIKKQPIDDAELGSIRFAPADTAYTPPPLSILERDKGKPEVGDIKANANLIKRTLQNFGITVEMDEVSIGPTVTRYALKPAEGVRLQKILSLQNNLELALAAHPIRIEAPIPGKSLVGIEVPNTTKATVGLASLLAEQAFQNDQRTLLFALGRDIAGSSHFANIAKMPHLLVAGATGSGKSVSIHALVTSLLYRNGPATLRFIMVDPKRVELTLYNAVPHLLSPVITESKKAILALKWAAKEMERRYDILEKSSVRDINSYHENILGKWSGQGEAPDQMPYIVIIVDELADIMQSYPRELEAAIVRLAQMSRAVGIHLVLSTQRPSVNVITGLIKANIPARIALQVASQIDSRTILDAAGAEKLLGAGDMLYLSGDMGKPHRIQTAYISETEVKSVVAFIAKHNEPATDSITLSGTTMESPNAIFSASLDGEEVDDDLFEEAKKVVEEAGKASTSFLQRKLRIGYARAARLMDILEEKGIIGPADGARPRDVLTGNRAGTPIEEDTSDETPA